MNATTELLAPYAAALDGIQARSPDRVTLAEALIRQEAAHVADIRNARMDPRGGWKNQLPLEHATLLGFWIRGQRTGDMTLVRAALAVADTKEHADTLLNARNVFVDGYNWHVMSTDQLIDAAAADRYHA
jgi:hypothetical protein